MADVRLAQITGVDGVLYGLDLDGAVWAFKEHSGWCFIGRPSIDETVSVVHRKIVKMPAPKMRRVR
jgi:hypothetical protein